MGTNQERSAVIGAGAAGLCAAKHLLAREHQVTIYELGSQIGGLWVYQNDNGRSPAYRSLHINSEGKVTGFRDFPMPKDAPLFPSHEQIRAFLEAYAEQFDLHRHVQFNTQVTAVDPADGDAHSWRVTLADGSEQVFDRVVVANGHQAVPMHPPFAGDFTGEYLHSWSYRTPEPFARKEVLVIGTGNSSLDIAADVCTVTRCTTISARSPVLIMPRMLLGVPLARILAQVERPWLPWPIRRRFRELITRIVHGPMEEWGFTTPKKQTHPASHPTIMGHIAWNRIAVRPGIAEVDGTKVHFTDGTVQDFDVIIAGTGYEIDLPFLADEVSPVEGHRVDLYRRIVHPGRPSLYFIGLFDVSGGANIRMMDIQCRWLAAVVAGEVALPNERAMRKEYRAEQRRMSRQYPDRPRYGLELDPREYGLTIRADLQQAKERAQKEQENRPERATRSDEGFREPVG